MHTAVFHSGALGDSVILWPLLRGLGPASLITRPSLARLAEAHLPNTTGFDGDHPRYSALFGADTAIEPQVADQLAGADRVISFVDDGTGPWTTRVRSLTNAPILFAATRPPITVTTPVGAWQHGVLRKQGLGTTLAAGPRRNNVDGPVLLCPGSGGAAKRWRLDAFEQTAAALAEAGRAVGWVLGPVEAETWRTDELKRLDTASIIRPPDPLALSETLAAASLVIANDSGPAHLAAALGVPTVAVFGTTDPRVWKPIGARVRTVGNPADGWSDADAVLAAATGW